jgi:hypothetical protein
MRKSFGLDRRATIEWVEEMRVLRRTGTAAHEREAGAQKEDVVTVATLCSAFLAYVKSHPEKYRDQKNPPRRIEEIAKRCAKADNNHVKHTFHSCPPQ